MSVIKMGLNIAHLKFQTYPPGASELMCSVWSRMPIPQPAPTTDHPPPTTPTKNNKNNKTDSLHDTDDV